MANPCLHQRLLDTPGQVWVSLLWGHCSFLLGPGAHKVLFVPSKSLFPQSCVSTDGSMVGLKVTSCKRAYDISRSTAPRALASAAAHCWPVPPQETLKHSSVSVSVWSLGPRFVWTLWVSLAGMRFDSILNVILPLLLSCWGFSFTLGHKVSPQSHFSTVQSLLQHCTANFVYKMNLISVISLFGMFQGLSEACQS